MGYNSLVGTAWDLKKHDWKKATEIYQKEIIPRPLDKQNMFLAGTYSILSAAQDYQNQIKGFKKMLDFNLSTPQDIIDDKDKLRHILRTVRYPNQKTKRIHNLATLFLDDNFDIFEKIIEDSNNGREYEFELRDEVAKTVPGLGIKCSSLFLIKCGYNNVVPIDTWMFKFLRDMDYVGDIKTDYSARSIPTSSHRKFENTFLEYVGDFKIDNPEVTETYNLTPALFQCALWGKYSTYNRKTPKYRKPQNRHKGQKIELIPKTLDDFFDD